ncbi:MAG: hypothetical protein JW915_15150 [Chitinispirillaceae bacterium]|nr:hypothetical protein [Chitinispirillaceae bacterium]
MFVKKPTLCIIILTLALPVHPRVLTVSKSGGDGMYNTISIAVKNAGNGDSIIILDNGIYEEQVSLDSTKSGIVLCSKNPLLQNKPGISFQDNQNIGPRNRSEAENACSTTYIRNGALRLYKVRDVVIDGIMISGTAPEVFSADDVYLANAKVYPMQSGNVAVSVCMSGDVHIRNCDIRDAYIGLHITDKNPGGIFALLEPSYNKEEIIVPFSGFGQTGNHLIEYNRIHDNSFGVKFEDTHDRGSVVRNNLFYENHHITDEFARKVKKLTAEGSNQPGGAFWFFDTPLSPLAIYNNTFWHNYLIFAGGWRPPVQALVFNNIYAAPYRYLMNDSIYGEHFMEISSGLSNRMHHCVYSCQSRPAEQFIYHMTTFDTVAKQHVNKEINIYKPRVMNSIGNVESTTVNVLLELSNETIIMQARNVIVEGNLISSKNSRGFPWSAEIRWLETKFVSTDPSDENFLVPDWNDSLVKNFILDRGWPLVGNLDIDGTPADLGAISYAGRAHSEVTIKPVKPVINRASTNAEVGFVINVKNEFTFKNPTISFLRWIRWDNTTVSYLGEYGSGSPPIPPNCITRIPVAFKPIPAGADYYQSFTIPALSSKDRYGFFEMIIKGTDNSGNEVYSPICFIPYKKFDHSMDVQVLNSELTDTVIVVTVGQPYILRLVPRTISGNQILSTRIDTVAVRLQSGNTLNSAENEVCRIPGGIPEGAGKLDTRIFFTKVPADSFDVITVAARFTQASDTFSIWGESLSVKVIPALAVKADFYNPGEKETVLLQKKRVFHLYDLRGRLVKTIQLQTRNDKLKLYAKQFPGGLYIIREKGQNSPKTIKEMISNRRINMLVF